MAKIRFAGLEEYERRLSQLQTGSREMAGKAIYEGAAIMIEEIKKGIEALPIRYGFGTEEEPLMGGVTETQKQGLQDGIGIAKMQENNGFYDVKIGFDGYNATKTEKYPNGQPNQLVARAVESGTSWKEKWPFVRPAVLRARKRVESKMAEVLDQEIKKIMDD